MITDKLTKAYDILNTVNIGYKDFDFSHIVYLADLLDEDEDETNNLIFIENIKQAAEILNEFGNLHVTYQSVLDLAVILFDEYEEDYEGTRSLIKESYILLSDYTVGYNLVVSDDVLTLYNLLSYFIGDEDNDDKDLFRSKIKEAYHTFTNLPPHDYDQKGLIELGYDLLFEAKENTREITYL